MSFDVCFPSALTSSRISRPSTNQVSTNRKRWSTLSTFWRLAFWRLFWQAPRSETESSRGWLSSMVSLLAKRQRSSKEDGAKGPKQPKTRGEVATTAATKGRNKEMAEINQKLSTFQTEMESLNALLADTLQRSKVRGSKQKLHRTWWGTASGQDKRR